MREFVSITSLFLFAILVGAQAKATLPGYFPMKCMRACPQNQILRGCRCVDLGAFQCRPIQCPYLFIPCDKYKVDYKGCPTCECQCPSYLSSRPSRCTNGMDYTTNADGCRVCKCREVPPPPALCPDIKCANPCSSGQLTDSNGCPTCKCKAFECNPIRCPLLFIPCDKYKVDDRGCSTCDCQCSSLLSRRPPNCHNGVVYSTNADGCRVCTCREAPPPPALCPDIKCANPCSSGQLTDSNGCLTCKCKTFECMSLQCPRLETPCEKYKVDNNGCSTCDCQCSSLLSRRPPNCQNGVVYSTNADGCRVCTCREAPPPPPLCPVIKCANQCSSGQLTDSNGCLTCKCKTFECMSLQCPRLDTPCEKYKVDNNGCSTCDCQCSSILSRRPPNCQNGVVYSTNVDGCRVCKCREDPPPPPLCPDIKCANPCSSGQLSDSNGCPTCKCKAFECPSLQCPHLLIPCEKYKVDDKGCAMCECQCSSILSRRPPNCQNGVVYSTNDDGCRVCKCREDLPPPPLCPDIKCANPCSSGQLTDSNGCPTCKCKTFECQPNRCPQTSNPCDKYRVDDKGCPTCECQCPSLLSSCPTSCANGTEYATNDAGCRVCKCCNGHGTRSLCPQPKCTNQCSSGRLTDSNGCPSCECKAFKCPPLCRKGCRFGFETDGNGCSKCQCKPKPVQCGPVCEIHCPFGNVLDARGCRTCRCKPGSFKLFKVHDDDD